MQEKLVQSVFCLWFWFVVRKWIDYKKKCFWMVSTSWIVLKVGKSEIILRKKNEIKKMEKTVCIHSFECCLCRYRCRCLCVMCMCIVKCKCCFTNEMIFFSSKWFSASLIRLCSSNANELLWRKFSVAAGLFSLLLVEKVFGVFVFLYLYA